MRVHPRAARACSSLKIPVKICLRCRVCNSERRLRSLPSERGAEAVAGLSLSRCQAVSCHGCAVIDWSKVED
jgi:hypothetical protein